MFAVGYDREVDENLLSHEEDAARVAVAVDIERAVLVQELDEIHACEIARRVVKKHVLGAGIRRVDGPGVRTRVPPIDRRVVLYAGIGARPRRLAEALP